MTMFKITLLLGSNQFLIYWICYTFIWIHHIARQFQEPSWIQGEGPHLAASMPHPVNPYKFMSKARDFITLNQLAVTSLALKWHFVLFYKMNYSGIFHSVYLNTELRLLNVCIASPRRGYGVETLPRSYSVGMEMDKVTVKLLPPQCQLCSVGGNWIFWFSLFSLNLIHSFLCNAALSNHRNCLARCIASRDRYYSRYYIYHVKFTSSCELIECSRPIGFFIVSLMYNITIEFMFAGINMFWARLRLILALPLPTRSFFHLTPTPSANISSPQSSTVTKSKMKA